MKILLKALAAIMLVTTSVNFLSAQKKYKHAQGEATVEHTRTTMNAIELEMVKEINAVRTDPKGYTKHIQWYIDNHAFNAAEKATGTALIAELNKLAPRKALKAEDCLLIAARDHAINQAPTGDLSHTDTNGKNPWDRVLASCSKMKDGNENLEGSASSVANYANNARKANCNLLIDHGVQGYGHRYNILDPKWTHVAAFTYKDTEGTSYYRHRWIQKFGQEGARANSTAGNNSTGNGTTGSNQGSGNTNGIPNSGLFKDNAGKYYNDGKEVTKAEYCRVYEQWFGKCPE